MDRPKLIDSRDRDLASTDLSRNYIVEAAAGTGKTTTLVTRILNLITGERVTPDEIVAITFTERAAAELKAKLREAQARLDSGDIVALCDVQYYTNEIACLGPLPTRPSTDTLIARIQNRARRV